MGTTVTKAKDTNMSIDLGAKSSVVQETLQLYAFSLTAAQLEYIKAELTKHLNNSSGTTKSNYKKILQVTEGFITAKRGDVFTTIAPTVATIPTPTKRRLTVTPAVAVSVTPIVSDGIKPQASAYKLTIPVSKTTKPEMYGSFNTVTPPLIGAAPGTTKAFVRTPLEDSRPIVAMPAVPARTTYANEIEVHAAFARTLEEELQGSTVQQLCYQNNWPTLKVLPFIDENNKVIENVVVVGTATAFINGSMHDVNCSVNEKIITTSDRDFILTDLSYQPYRGHKSCNVNGQSENRWIRLLKYQEGMLFRFWKHNRQIKKDAEKAYFTIQDGQVIQIEGNMYRSLSAQAGLNRY